MGFSVLLSVYNNEKAEFFTQAMHSIWDEQILKPNEIVLVKDGPLTSDLETAIEDLQGKLNEVLKVVTLEKNVGLGEALNEGLKHCSYELVARMDTDDIATKDRFKKQITYLENNPNISVLGAAMQEFESDPDCLGKIRHLPSNHDEILKFTKLRNSLNHPTVVFRKSHILEVGSYKKMDYFEDYFLWVRVLQKDFKINNLEDVVLKYRIGNDMIGRRIGWSYVKKEFTFFKNIYQIKYLSFLEFLKAILFRIPLRLLPKKSLSFIYQKFLRRKIYFNKVQ